ncbi:MAG: TM0106 family RecB-like putative nuclease, partial [Longimicrobiales bacterium]
CSHLSLLDRRTALGGPKPPVYDDPALDLLRRRGELHEQAFLDRLKSDRTKRVVEIVQPDRALPHHERWARLTDVTLKAMQDEADVIFQAGLFDGTWLGRADFLVRVEKPGIFGPWSYEVVDTKLAREAKGGALLQVLLYADLLEQVQGVSPEHVHIALGGPEPRTETFRVADYAAYFRSIRRRFLDHISTSGAPLPVAPEPVEHCGICAWDATCGRERRDVDHLALVAGISRDQRRGLRDCDVATVANLAALPLPPVTRIEGVSASALTRIREQARIQVEGRTSGRHVHELLTPVVAGQGLAALPEPSTGDLFFDLEGDPYAFDDGIEYLFGFADRAGQYTPWWAFDRADERLVFERFIDFLMLRLEQYPDLHVYHFAPYETTALKKLMGRYATRENEIDRLLRAGVFVDLHRVVRQGLRASVESYSIKKLEPFYGYTRDVDLRDARSALAQFEAWLELGGEPEPMLVDRIRGYNRDDVIST